jgi:hypothetical protein
MKSRILTIDEWERVRPEGAPPLFPFVDPANISVVVVEKDDGQIVACMTVLRVTHFEGIWVDGASKGNPGVIRSLLRLATALPRVRREKWIFGGSACGSDGSPMREYIARLGGSELPMKLHALSVDSLSCSAGR